MNGLKRIMKSKKTNPMFSIITVVYNDVKNIEKTIKSVLNQTYKDFEYIIIDGKSDDGTVEKIKKYEKEIDYWVSEKDKGIYDAMNKGARKAKGKYVYFLNCGDIFYSKGVLEEVSQKLGKGVDLIFGKTLKIYQGYTTVTPLKIEDLKFGIMPCHQATFVKTAVLEELGFFNSSFKSAADFDFYCRFYLKGYTHEKMDVFISKFLTGGFSSDKRNSYPEGVVLIKKHFGFYYGYLYYLKKIIFEQNIKKILLKLGLDSFLGKLQKYNNTKKA